MARVRTTKVTRIKETERRQLEQSRCGMPTMSPSEVLCAIEFDVITASEGRHLLGIDLYFSDETASAEDV